MEKGKYLVDPEQESMIGTAIANEEESSSAIDKESMVNMAILAEEKTVTQVKAEGNGAINTYNHSVKIREVQSVEKSRPLEQENQKFEANNKRLEESVNKMGEENKKFEANNKKLAEENQKFEENNKKLEQNGGLQGYL